MVRSWPTLSLFIEARYGKNWGVAYRKSERIKRKYGDDVAVIHPKTYRKLYTEFEAAQTDGTPPVDVVASAAQEN